MALCQLSTPHQQGVKTTQVVIVRLGPTPQTNSSPSAPSPVRTKQSWNSVATRPSPPLGMWAWGEGSVESEGKRGDRRISRCAAFPAAATGADPPMDFLWGKIIPCRLNINEFSVSKAQHGSRLHFMRGEFMLSGLVSWKP